MKMVIMMMRTSASLNDHSKIMSEDQELQSIIISSSTCPMSWKLYNNPFFSSTNTPPNHCTSPLKLKHLQKKYSASVKYIHQLQSDHKMSSFTISSDREARTQVAELKAELEMERKLRKKMEMLNKKLSRELIEEADKSKERMCVCEDLKKEISRLKDEMARMKEDMDEERKMLRLAEILREERVQMKLADAQLFYHNQLLNQILPLTNAALPSNVGNSKRFPTLCEQSDYRNVTTSTSNSSCGSIKNASVQRKASPEAENPHIKQGINGFVEFQRAIKARNGSNNNGFTCRSVGSNKQFRDLGSFNNKLECQKAQLRAFFKHKCPLPYSHNEHLILS